jgi:Putative papain-like cysteine peptidase (DUF1796)
MLKKLYQLILIVIFSSLGAENSSPTSQDPLYVNLGGECMVVNMLQHFGKRQAAFPFDWVRIVDEVGFLEILKNNFKDFLNEKYLILHVTNYSIFHTLYHTEFVLDWSDGYWTDPQQLFALIQSKYQRRIERFQQLAHYKGPVVFIRIMGLSYRYPQLQEKEEYCYPFTPIVEAQDIKAFSLKLQAELKNLFPRLDFKLIVVTRAENQNAVETFNNITLYSFLDVKNPRHWEQIFHQESSNAPCIPVIPK